ncbi:MAG: hypothetical protein L6Q71_09080, partial [Planctomycetes bacterium]|nr:hypothetical protein [Planctomycetota bacterium]
MGGLVATSDAIGAIMVQYFLFVDVYLGRALIHYFGSGAVAFISLRYLRKRPVSLASVIGISVGVAVLIVVNSIMSGFVSDYRKLARGSLSDVLIDVQGSALGPMESDIERELWAQYLKRVAEHPDAPDRWAHAQALALQGMRASRAIELENSPEFPKGLKPEPRDDAERTMLDTLNSPFHAGGSGRRWLPEHPTLGVATPENIILSYIVNTNDRKEQARNAYSRAQDELFLPRLQAGMALLSDAAMKHQAPNGGPPDVVATSPRLSNFAPISAERKADIFEEITSITAVDPEREPMISEFGAYVADAEFSGFVSDYARWPLLSLLGACLVFEDPEYAPSHPELRAVENRDGKLVVKYGGGLTLLSNRQIITHDGKVTWPRLHAVRFREDSPGEEAVGLIERAIKKLAGASDVGGVRVVLSELMERWKELVDERLKMTGSTIDQHRVTRSIGSRDYLGDDHALVRLWDDYFDGMGEVRGRITFSLVTNFSDELNQRVEILEEDWTDLTHLSNDLRVHAYHFVRTKLPRAKTLNEANEFVRLELLELRKKTEPFIASHEERLQAKAARVLTKLEELHDETLFLVSDEVRPRSSAIGRVLDHWTSLVGAMERRREAYSRVLPLRTLMLEGETVEEYLHRARNILPLIPEGMLDNPEVVAKARVAAKARLTSCFLPYRIVPLGLDSALHAEIGNRIGAAVAQFERDFELGAFANIDAVQTALNQHVASLGEDLRQLATERGTAGNTALQASLALLDPVAYAEYWRLRVMTPGIIVGEALADRLRKGAGDTVKLWVVRKGRSSDGRLELSQSKEMAFTIQATYRSGMFDDSLRTMYGDFESWAGLLGADSANYLLCARLASYAPYEGRAVQLIDEIEALLVRHVRAVRVDGAASREMKAAAYAITNPRVSVWELQQAKLLQAVEREKNILVLMVSFIMVLAGVVIMIVVYLTVVEKVKDIGIMKALGASPWGVRSVFMFNALFIGLFGTLLGAGLG